LLLQAFGRHGYQRPEFLRKQVYPIFFDHPSEVSQLRIGVADFFVPLFAMQVLVPALGSDARVLVVPNALAVLPVPEVS